MTPAHSERVLALLSDKHIDSVRLYLELDAGNLASDVDALRTDLRAFHNSTSTTTMAKNAARNAAEDALRVSSETADGCSESVRTNAHWRRGMSLERMGGFRVRRRMGAVSPCGRLREKWSEK